MMAPFELNERLAADSHPVCSLQLCDVRLMNDCRYRWLLLVPRRSGVSEWHDLSGDDAVQLSREIHLASAALKRSTSATKINVAAIGNMVRQMHVHVVARHDGDATWPGTVWNAGTPDPYGADVLAEVLKEIGQELAPG